LEAEMTEHLGHAKHEPVTNPSGNARNGKSRKNLKGDFGELSIEIPRDLHGSFQPEIRRIIYTTNAIESVNMSLRKITKNLGSFPNDEALSKLFYRH
jgi:transposase-like protein